MERPGTGPSVITPYACIRASEQLLRDVVHLVAASAFFHPDMIYLVIQAKELYFKELKLLWQNYLQKYPRTLSV